MLRTRFIKYMILIIGVQCLAWRVANPSSHWQFPPLDTTATTPDVDSKPTSTRSHQFYLHTSGEAVRMTSQLTLQPPMYHVNYQRYRT